MASATWDRPASSIMGVLTITGWGECGRPLRLLLGVFALNGEWSSLCSTATGLLGRTALGAKKKHHGCAYPMANGEACNKPHGALTHDKTPH